MQQSMSMSEIQQVALSVLKQVAQVCEQQGFRYTLAFGTLIGAVRHQGFIPWDDDIDLLMPRPDYERLLAYLAENPLPNLKVMNLRTNPKVFFGLTRICDGRYRVIEDQFYDYGLGIFIDIYPVDGLADDIEEAKARYPYAFNLGDIALDIVRKDVKVWRPALPFKARIHRCLRFLNYHLHGNRFYLNKLEAYARSRRFEDYRYVGNINWSWRQLCFDRQWFDDCIKVPFEDASFYIVRNYDEMLRQQYGDYMQLPPVEERVYHHFYSAYRK